MAGSTDFTTPRYELTGALALLLCHYAAGQARHGTLLSTALEKLVASPTRVVVSVVDNNDCDVRPTGQEGAAMDPTFIFRVACLKAVNTTQKIEDF